MDKKELKEGEAKVIELAVNFRNDFLQNLGKSRIFAITHKQDTMIMQMEHPYKGEEKFLVNDLKTIVSKARSKAFAAVNYSLVERNWRIGKRIVEEEQNGAARAEY